ncbi:MAG: hemolysin family protein [Rickettsiaceae bacterium]
MPENLDPEEPSETRNSLKYRIKDFFNTLFNRSSALTEKQNSYTNQEEITKTSHIQQDIITKNFESFTEKTVEDVMIPRSDIISVSYDISLEELSKTIIKYGHTRTLVYKDNLDNVIGFLHIKDLFEIIAKSKKYSLKKLMRKHIVSPHSMTLIDLLRQMQINRTHIAIVVDEYGGTDGIVTIEDVIESIVGKIDDEHDTDLDLDTFKILKPGLLVATARMEVEELEKLLNVKLRKEDDEFDTIGGLVLAKAGTVPEKGDVIIITKEVTVEIIDSTPRTIKQLRITCSKK